MKFKTLGCRLNTFETETIKSIAEKKGFKGLNLFKNLCGSQRSTRKKKK